jgi:hypothetical protein
MNFNGGAIIPDEDYDKHQTIYKYILHLYLIGIYVYSMYITRYGLTEKEYDILTNVDAQEVHSSNHLNNLFLQTYIGNILETFNSKYTTEELEKARDAYKLYLDNLPEPDATVPDASTEGIFGAITGTPVGAATAA